ncbi:uncharacterized protein LOC119869613 isoform X2 [Canis lupus familiaris]|nr:uncharacterized protein LOC119869613 isoform X2 [Canis lupus familiaris]XP_038545541.1 uncharacterized protein LOC119869613 isoform X2 [Canis lupus familiaris]
MRRFHSRDPGALPQLSACPRTRPLPELLSPWPATSSVRTGQHTGCGFRSTLRPPAGPECCPCIQSPRGGEEASQTPLAPAPPECSSPRLPGPVSAIHPVFLLAPVVPKIVNPRNHQGADTDANTRGFIYKLELGSKCTRHSRAGAWTPRSPTVMPASLRRLTPHRRKSKKFGLIMNSVLLAHQRTCGRHSNPGAVTG